MPFAMLAIAELGSLLLCCGLLVCLLLICVFKCGRAPSQKPEEEEEGKKTAHKHKCTAS
jgi:hypothetical protein